MERYGDLPNAKWREVEAYFYLQSEDAKKRAKDAKKNPNP